MLKINKTFEIINDVVSYRVNQFQLYIGYMIVYVCLIKI